MNRLDRADSVVVRLVRATDREEWLRLRHALWPKAAQAELREDLEPMLASLDLVPVFVAERPDGGLCGLLEAGIRETAPGCETCNVGYLEGWYVDRDMRRRGVGRRLVEEAERWARQQGCVEMASDTEADYPDSPSAHRALGYEETSTPLTFRKSL